MDNAEYYSILVKEASSERNIFYYENVKKYGEYPPKGFSGYSYTFAYLKVYDEFNRQFKLNEIAGSGDTFNKSLNIMNWISMNTQYNGYSSLPPVKSDEIIEFSFSKGFDGAINCANKAILLSDCLMSIGIIALPVWIQNQIVDADNKYFGCGSVHVVVHIYIQEKNKWIMFDPSFNAYISDNNGNILNLVEIRSIYRKSNSDRELNLNNYSFNGNPELFKDFYISDFIIKHLFTINTWYGNGYEKRLLHEDRLLMPLNFDYMTYFKKKSSLFGDEDERNYILQYCQNLKAISIEEFLAKPSIYSWDKLKQKI
jgi:hypothetical protein